MTHGHNKGYHFISDSIEGIEHEPLLHIDPMNIVPLPLHTLLGLVNKCIECMKKLCCIEKKLSSTDKKDKIVYDECKVNRFNSIIDSIKTTCTDTGKAAVHTLSGNEIRNLLNEKKYQCQHKIITMLESINRDDRHRIKTMFQWCHLLYDHLLDTRIRTQEEIQLFRDNVNIIWSEWHHITQCPPTPKCHMLYHIVEFISRHGCIGKYSESCMESFHHIYNRIVVESHKNLGANEAEQMRRTLADTAVNCAVHHLG